MPSLIKRCNGKKPNREFKFPPVSRWIPVCFSTVQGVNSWLPFVIYLMMFVVLPNYGKRSKKRLAIILLVQIPCLRGQHLELIIGSSSRVRARRRSNSIPWCTSIHVILSVRTWHIIISNLQHAWSERRSQCSMWMVSKHVSVQQLLLLRLSSWLIFTVL